MKLAFRILFLILISFPISVGKLFEIFSWTGNVLKIESQYINQNYRLKKAADFFKSYEEIEKKNQNLVLTGNGTIICNILTTENGNNYLKDQIRVISDLTNPFFYKFLKVKAEVKSKEF